MCGHLEKVSRRTASLHIKALSTDPPSNAMAGSRPFNRSFMEDAIGNAGIYLFNLFNSITNPEHTSFRERRGNSRHTVFHYNKHDKSIFNRLEIVTY